MATFNSTEYAKQIAVPPVPLDPTEDRGRIRLEHFTLTGIVSATIGDLLNLVKLPAGKVRILRSSIKHGAWAASSTLAIGNLAATNSDKTTLAASANSILAATAMNNTTDIDVLAGVTFDTTTGVVLQGTVGTAAGGTLPATVGWIEYVQD
jgi:hypothetical protein